MKGLLMGAALLLMIAFSGMSLQQKNFPPETGKEITTMRGETEKGKALATFGGGCFWCMEAVFEGYPGVEDVISGYAGGSTKNPGYHQVSSGKTGHAEIVRIMYDPEKVSFKQLLELFFKAHDPTTLNRQGADMGTQYRSIILYHDETQLKEAQKYIDYLNASGKFNSAIVTELKPFDVFYKAEDYHQDYYRKNPDAAYCEAVIEPKLNKLGFKILGAH